MTTYYGYATQDATNALTVLRYNHDEGVSIVESVKAEINWVISEGVSENMWAVY